MGKVVYDFRNFVDLDDDEKKLVWRWRNHESIRKWSFNHHEFNLEHHLDFVESLGYDFTRKYWLVTRNKNMLGVISVINLRNDVGELGYYIAPESQGKHMSVEFLYNSFCYLFEKNGIKGLKAYVFLSNGAGNHMMDIFGFTKELTKRKNNGRAEDCNYRILTYETWLNSIKNNNKITETLRISADL